MRVEDLASYEVLEKREIADLNSVGYLCRHKKTGAKVALLSNDDENKVFYIGFRTPPKDSTGVAHILEHSVLCGSREFPVKDPFVELVKGSLNTFLNAMTYPDKTLYPVASCNDKDFQNLMHVYMDAVFYPNIYEKEAIFRQEGWHYELSEDEQELTVNGVVYNEMKGVFSSPDDMLEREMMNALFPDNTYGYESGGDPEAIPELSYQEFLEFHERYYHPSNSYIYLYGNMDMAEKLQFIDEHYLSGYVTRQIDSEIVPQSAFKEPVRVVKEYPISEEEKEEENTFLSVNYCVGDTLDKEKYMAFQILDYALCSAPGAPLKQRLVDLGIGKDVYSDYENGIKQTYFSIVAKDTSLDKEQAFLQTIDEVLQELVEKGMDKKALLAGLNYFEFKYREADFGSYPKGLMYGLQMLDSWLYDEKAPFMHVEANATFASLREKVETDYFEQLIRGDLLENSHRAVVILAPKKGLAQEREQRQKEQLAACRASMSETDLQKIRDMNEALQAFQETEDSKEDLEKIPMLTRQDMTREARDLVNDVRTMAGSPFLYHNIFTNGIGYIRFLFDLRNIPEAYFPYLGILKGCLGLLNTKSYSYGDLYNEMYLVSGGVSASNALFPNSAEPEAFKIAMDIKTKVFYPNMEKALALIEEMLLSSDFTDTKRLYEILTEGKSRMQAQMQSGGHSVAMGRAVSYTSVTEALAEQLSGIDFYRFTCELVEHFEERKGELCEKLQELAKMVFRPENLLVDYVGEEDRIPVLEQAVEGFKGRLYTVPVEKAVYLPQPERKNEGFMTAGQVQYVCRAGNYKKKGLPYTGALRALKVMLGYEYLWTNVRVKGGAYGCRCGFSRTGASYFVSYRDPNLAKTVDVYEKAAQAIAGYQGDERTILQYIIGAISDLDVPMTPPAKGKYSLSAYMSGVTQEMLQQERDELLAVTAEDLRGLSAYIEAFMDEKLLCVVGESGKIKEQKDLFMKIENLL